MKTGSFLFGASTFALEDLIQAKLRTPIGNQEAKKEGTTLLIVNLEGRHSRLLALGSRHKTQHQGIRFTIDHAVDHDLVQRQVISGRPTNANQLVQILKRNRFLCVIRSVRSDKHCLPYGIRAMHPLA